MLALLAERGMESKKEEVYNRILAMDDPSKENLVKELFAPFSDEEVSKKVAEIIAPKDIEAEVSVVFQTVENLNAACPQHLGDWYFTGNYPTPGGNKVVNRAFVNFMEGKTVRAY